MSSTRNAEDYSSNSASYGRLAPVEAYTMNGRGYMRCICSCGKPKDVRMDHLRAGKVRSCGCLAREVTKVRSTTHGMAARGAARTPEYRAWSKMNSKCHNVNDDHYKDYGGRGITVHPSWRAPAGFLLFLNHIGRRPNSQYTVDRKNNDKGYCPGNVHWVTMKRQARNRRNTIMVRLGARTQALADWCDEKKMPRLLVYNRIYKLGWTPKKALAVKGDAR